MRFREIIFPPKPKVTTLPTSNPYEFNSWIIGPTADTKVLWAQCPVCLYTYEVMNAYNEARLRRNMREYEPFYFRKIVRECPNASKH